MDQTAKPRRRLRPAFAGGHLKPPRRELELRIVDVLRREREQQRADARVNQRRAER